MPAYAYRGRNSRGDTVRGTIDAQDAAAVADQLMSTGVVPVDIQQALGGVSLAAPGWWRQLTAPAVSMVDLMLFSRQMHTLLRSGVPILRALAGLEESTPNASLKEVIRDLRVSLDSGRELSSAMERHPKVFDGFYISLVKVGEVTGLLETVFLRLAEHVAFEKEMRDRVKAALRYPTMVVAAMAAVILIINIFVIPVFANVYKNFGAELPLVTRGLLAFSAFLVSYWYLLLGAGVGAVFAFRAWTATAPGRLAWDRVKLRLPIAGKIILKATLARFARSLALAIQSGVPIVQGLNTVTAVADNAWIGKRVEGMREGVERGESVLRTAIAAGVFTPVVIQMIAVGDETGEMDALMFEVARMYEGDVEYELKTLSQQIEPILIVFLAGLVLLLALAVFLPLWDLGRVAFKK